MNNRTEYTLRDKIDEWTSTKRQVVGLVAGAILGCYLPYIPLTLVGVWINNWLNMVNNLTVTAILIMVAFFVERTKKPAIIYGVVVGLLLLAMATMMVLSVPIVNWVYYWMLPYYLVASVVVCHKVYRYFVQ